MPTGEYQANIAADSGGLAWGTAQIPESIGGSWATSPGRTSWSSAAGRRSGLICSLPCLGLSGRAGPSERQLEHARRLMAEAGVEFPLIHGSAEAVPLPDATFDIVFCDHGAMSFADPY